MVLPLPQLKLVRATGKVADTPAFNANAGMLERADIANAKVNMENSFPSILLIDANKQAWRVTVSTTGVLQTAVVQV